MSIIYEAKRRGPYATVMVRDDSTEGSTGRQLCPRYDLRNHSPSGFEWGYNGSGPAQLALAILADAVGDELAQKHYQEFKRDYIANQKYKGFVVTRDYVQGWVEYTEAIADGDETDARPRPPEGGDS